MHISSRDCRDVKKQEQSSDLKLSPEENVTLSIFNCWCRPCLLLSLVLSSTSCEDSCSTLTALLKQTIHILPVKQLFCLSTLIIRLIWHQQVGVGIFLQLRSVTHTVYNTIATHILARLCYRYLLSGSLSELQIRYLIQADSCKPPSLQQSSMSIAAAQQMQGNWKFSSIERELMQITTCHKLKCLLWQLPWIMK